MRKSERRSLRANWDNLKIVMLIALALLTAETLFGIKVMERVFGAETQHNEEE